MKKTRWIFLWLACLVIISGCRPMKLSQPEKVVMAFMDSMVDGDLEKTMEYISMDDKDFMTYARRWGLPEGLLDNRDYLKEINLAHMENLSYRLELIKEDKDGALVAVKVNRKNLEDLDEDLKELVNKEKLDDEIIDTIIGKINSVKDYKDLDGLISLKKEDKNYYIDFKDRENIRNLRRIFFEE